MLHMLADKDDYLLTVTCSDMLKNPLRKTELFFDVGMTLSPIVT
jgi:hypothetical protein